MKNTFEITTEQVLEIFKNNFLGHDESIKLDLKNWFPGAFEDELKNGTWYKSSRTDDNTLKHFLINITDIHIGTAFGFSGRGEWKNEGAWCGFNNLVEASKAEVESALSKEAKKRYEKGDAFLEVIGKHPQKCKEEIKTCKSCSEDPYALQFGTGNGLIYYNGKWAKRVTETETITRRQAEKLLNKKIV